MHDFDQLIKSAEQGIGLVREYHTRLIADVVTGKLDVREVAPQLPVDFASESYLDDDSNSDEDDAFNELGDEGEDVINS